MNQLNSGNQNQSEIKRKNDNSLELPPVPGMIPNDKKGK
jgi:hypothetical protein